MFVRWSVSLIFVCFETKYWGLISIVWILRLILFIFLHDFLNKRFWMYFILLNKLIFDFWDQWKFVIKVKCIVLVSSLWLLLRVWLDDICLRDAGIKVNVDVLIRVLSVLLCFIEGRFTLSVLRSFDILRARMIFSGFLREPSGELSCFSCLNLLNWGLLDKLLSFFDHEQANDVLLVRN